MSQAPRDVTLLWEHRVSLNGTKLVRWFMGSPRGLGAWSGEEAAIRESEGDPGWVVQSCCSQGLTLAQKNPLSCSR